MVVEEHEYPVKAKEVGTKHVVSSTFGAVGCGNGEVNVSVIVKPSNITKLPLASTPIILAVDDSDSVKT